MRARLLCGAAATAFLLAGPALATGETATTAQTDAANQAVEEMVAPENLVDGVDGASHAKGGPAEPVENWFGCPPENGLEPGQARQCDENALSDRNALRDQNEEPPSSQ